MRKSRIDTGDFGALCESITFAPLDMSRPILWDGEYYSKDFLVVFTDVVL